jgi:PLP dependent protein
MIAANIEKIKQQLPGHVKLIAVSKTKPVELLQEAYNAGQRAFGENKVQEMTAKQPLLPADTEWHLIGHLQSNKVKYIAPFVHLIHSVDSLKLLEVINKEAIKNNRIIDCLLQVHIAEEETKFGLDRAELTDILQHHFSNVRIRGLMGMATNTGNAQQIEHEFTGLKHLFDNLKSMMHPAVEPDTFDTLSMGMSSDYQIAVKCGSTMVRVGSLVFGSR